MYALALLDQHFGLVDNASFQVVAGILGVLVVGVDALPRPFACLKLALELILVNDIDTLVAIMEVIIIWEQAVLIIVLHRTLGL